MVSFITTEYEVVYNGPSLYPQTKGYHIVQNTSGKYCYIDLSLNLYIDGNEVSHRKPVIDVAIDDSGNVFFMDEDRAIYSYNDLDEQIDVSNIVYLQSGTIVTALTNDNKVYNLSTKEIVIKFDLESEYIVQYHGTDYFLRNNGKIYDSQKNEVAFNISCVAFVYGNVDGDEILVGFSDSQYQIQINGTPGTFDDTPEMNSQTIRCITSEIKKFTSWSDDGTTTTINRLYLYITTFSNTPLEYYINSSGIIKYNNNKITDTFSFQTKRLINSSLKTNIPHCTITIILLFT